MNAAQGCQQCFKVVLHTISETPEDVRAAIVENERDPQGQSSGFVCLNAMHKKWTQVDWDYHPPETLGAVTVDW